MFCVTWRIRKWRCALAAAALLVSFAVGLYAVQAVSAEKKWEPRVKVPIIMYHSLLKDPKRQGAYVISPQQFESDLQYLQKEGFTTVVMEDLFALVNEGKALPAKPVMLTFDDGYFNNYLYGFPLLKQYHSKMVLSPVGKYTDQYSEIVDEHANYSHVTWDELQEMRESGLVEVQNHSYDMHSANGGRKGAKRMAGETEEAYRNALMQDVGRMQQRVEEKIGCTPTTFTYPFGAVSKEALPLLKQMGFRATLECESRINLITEDPECLFGLGRFLRPSGSTSAQFFGKIFKNL